MQSKGGGLELSLLFWVVGATSVCCVIPVFFFFQTLRFPPPVVILRQISAMVFCVYVAFAVGTVATSLFPFVVTTVLLS